MSLCVIMAKCISRDTYCCRNYHRSNFESFAKCFYVCLWTYFWQHCSVTPVQDAAMNSYRCVAEIKMGQVWHWEWSDP